MTADRPSGKRQTVVAKAGKPRSLIAIVGSVSAAVAQHEPPGAHNTLAPGTAAETRQTTALGVRREKAALSSGCKAHPAIRSSRKQSEQSWR